MTLADMEQDLLLMKRHNFNAVRCSHYPNHPGALSPVRPARPSVDEANPETHGMTPWGGWRGIPPGSNAFLERVTCMVARGLPPCIIIWSLGNESGYGPAHDAISL